ncbi:hypothetical protein K7X08_033599 [Anisodus acutangulus]|uniref:Chalcone isomerase domain-containing protein n=2 Tax=Anisodus TaxID=243963 RepID=A0A9Q1M1Y9_9SOLA|nr:hypothetical protein K7X08_033599 [Anisodus acutangulus]
MPTTMEDVAAKVEAVEVEPKSGLALKSGMEKEKEKASEGEAKTAETIQEKPNCTNGAKTEEEKNEKTDPEKEPNGATFKEEEVPVEVEPKTGVSFAVRLEDGKQLKAGIATQTGLHKLTTPDYLTAGIYADNEKLKDLMRSKIGKAPSKPTKEIFQMVIDSDLGMMVRLVIVFSNLTMNMVRKNFDEGLGAAIKKLTGGKNEELTKKIMGEASDDIKLTSGSVIEISRFPGYVLQTKVKGEIVSKVESELLCRAFIYMYLGDDPFDKEAKEKFGASMLSLF